MTDHNVMEVLPGYRNEDLEDMFGGNEDALVEAGLSYDDARSVLGYCGPRSAEIVWETDFEPDVTTAPVPFIEVRAGPYVRIADREQHIQQTYRALSQLGLASRGTAASTEHAAVRRISDAQGSNAASYLHNVAGKTRERLWDARSTFMNSLGGAAVHDEVVLIGAWVGFRKTYSGPNGAEARKAYKNVLENAAGQFGYELPHVS